MNNWISKAALGLAAAALIAPASVLAQDKDDDEIRGERIVIERDADGRIVIDGKPMSDDDETIVLRVRPDDEEIEIERIGPDRRMLRDRVFRTAPGSQDRVFFGHRDGGDLLWRQAMPPDHFESFIDPPHVEQMMPMMKKFDFEFGESMREHAEAEMKVAELERESRQLANRARKADGAEKAEIEADLRAKLNEIYDKKMDLRQDQIARLETELQEQREKLDRRSEARDQLIDRRFRTLLGEEDIMDW